MQSLEAQARGAPMVPDHLRKVVPVNAARHMHGKSLQKPPSPCKKDLQLGMYVAHTGWPHQGISMGYLNTLEIWFEAKETKIAG